MPDKVTYEQPLNERTRTLLRLEFLFRQTDHHLRGDSIWDSRATLASILEIASTVGRSDLKSELIKELDRQHANLGRLDERSDVDSARLHEITARLAALSDTLQRSGTALGQTLRDNEFLSTLRQRSAIAGGTCEFDLPGYHHWLTRPPEDRRATLMGWLGQLDTLREVTGLLLGLIRESTPPRRRTAHDGLYQQSLDANAPNQMVRVLLPADTPYHAEISGGRHRVTVRFMMQPDLESRPAPVREDIEFEIACCAI